MEQKITKPPIPFALRYEEADKNIFNAVNEAAKVNKIPFYLLEEILVNILHQVRENANIELEKERALYAKQLAEYEEQKKEANNG